MLRLFDFTLLLLKLSFSHEIMVYQLQWIELLSLISMSIIANYKKEPILNSYHSNDLLLHISTFSNSFWSADRIWKGWQYVDDILNDVFCVSDHSINKSIFLFQFYEFASLQAILLEYLFVVQWLICGYEWCRGGFAVKMSVWMLNIEEYMDHLLTISLKVE